MKIKNNTRKSKQALKGFFNWKGNIMKEFEGIIGYTAERRELEQICDILKNPEVYAGLGVQAPNGLLLHGEPGVGKTLMARSFADASRMKIYICRKNEPNGKFVQVIKDTFDEAAAHAPAIVFFDDMDKFANEDSSHPNAEEFVTIQSCIDENKGKGVFVLATANDIDDLPDSLLRAGRFDRVMEICPPRGKDAEDIVSFYISQKRFVGEIDMRLISRILNGRSCAELETIINDAGIYAGYERKTEITMDHLMRASLSRIFEVPVHDLFEIYHPVDLEKGYNSVVSSVFHEAGHVVVAEVLYPGSTTLSTILHKKGDECGFTMTANHEHISSRMWEKISRIIGFGGRAAIDRVFGFMDEGSENDISDVNRGIFDEIGDQCIYGLDLYNMGIPFSSESLKLRTEQTRTVLSRQYYGKAKEILACNHKLFQRVAEELALHGILSMKEIKKLTDECGIITTALI